MTTSGPLDRALIAYCNSLQEPVRTTLGLDKIKWPENVKIGMKVVAEARITIGVKATRVELSHRGAGECIIDENGVLETQLLTDLEDAINRHMSSISYPVSIQVEFHTDQCIPKCTGLGFAGLHLDQNQIGFEDPRGLCEFDGPLGCHITGLDRIAEAMNVINDMVEGQSDLSMKVWDIWEDMRDGNPPGFFEQPVYALTELEAFLKHAVYSRGLDLTLDRLAAGDHEEVYGDSALTFMGRRVVGFDQDPHGHVLTLADIANEAAQKLVQNLPPKL